MTRLCELTLRCFLVVAFLFYVDGLFFLIFSVCHFLIINNCWIVNVLIGVIFAIIIVF